MKLRIIAVAAVLATVVTACATAPQVYEVRNAREYRLAKERVWDHLIQYFATNNIQIKTIDKSSGVIYAERAITSAPSGGKIADFADCGVVLFMAPVAQSIQLNVYVQDLGPAQSKATVTTSFSETRGNTMDHMRLSSPVTCNSTGNLEAHVLDAMGG